MMVNVSAASGLRERIERVRQKIDDCARRASRSPADVTLLAVSKTHPAEVIREAIAAGLHEFGENRVQEADAKITSVGRNSARWHLIGHLQSNKIRRALALFDVIHSLDSIALAQKLERVCGEESRDDLPVLIQLDLGHEATKTGIDENELTAMVNTVRDCEHLRLIGLMTIPPFFAVAEQVRPFFRRLRELRDALATQRAFGEHSGDLSMGMTNDYEVAIEEGATIVRVGTAVFGERQQSPE